jgi:hypothetical protein
MKKIVVFSFLCFAGTSNAENKVPNAEDKIPNADKTVLLESTFVGDKEQPAVSYFIPWKGNRTPDKLQWNIEEKHDQTLQIIDRDVLLNSMNIYNEMDLENSGTTSDTTD